MSRLSFITAGESHGPCLIAIVEGLPAGLAVDEASVAREAMGAGAGSRSSATGSRSWAA